jgi:YebC/PmpR family DNA-binding regulatory protein
MSGHSHAKTIKHQKNITDQKRGQLFSKMAKVISIAVKQGGPNPETNAKLQTAMDKAKEFNMPKDNVKRAIEQAVGNKDGAALEEVLFEAYGPGGVAIVIEGITDNRNRTLGEIKQVLNQSNGKMVGEGGVKWMFEPKGYIFIDPKSQEPNLQAQEALEMAAIEAGADDVRFQEEGLDIYTKVGDLEKVKGALTEKGIKIESSSLDLIAKEEMTVSEKEKEDCQKLFDSLDELDSVQNVYSNLA